MLLKQLKYFISIVEKGNFTEAAKENYISQSAISQQIQSLENELGYKLVDNYQLLCYKKDRKIIRDRREKIMKENKAESLIWIIFAIIGTMFVIIGLTVFGTRNNYENKVDTKGTITEISSYRDSTGDDEHEVYVSYTVGGRRYKSKLNGYSSSFYEGKEIDIYYDKDNPNNIGTKSLDKLFLIFPGIGMIFVIMGVSGIVIKIKNDVKEKSLKENGELIYADYVEIVSNNLYEVNGRHPYNIICEWNDPLDGKKYVFKSRNIWTDPESTIEERNIKQFPVYINRDNMKKYAIDIDVLTENILDLT